MNENLTNWPSDRGHSSDPTVFIFVLFACMLCSSSLAGQEKALQYMDTRTAACPPTAQSIFSFDPHFDGQQVANLTSCHISVLSL